MIIEIVNGTVKYVSSTGDWVAEMSAEGSTICVSFLSNTGTPEMSSGANYDNLVTFIGEVKADAISRGVNWSGN